MIDYTADAFGEFIRSARGEGLGAVRDAGDRTRLRFSRCIFTVHPSHFILPMKWLITGGCGFVGSNLADELLGQGREIALLDNFSRRRAMRICSGCARGTDRGWRLFAADIRDASAVNHAVRDFAPDCIAHLAGQVAMTTSLANPRLDFEINAGGTLNVLEAIRLQTPDTIVLYSSTNKVYGSLESLRCEEARTRYVLPDYPQGLDESLPLDGSSPYGCSKLCAEQYCRDYHRMFGLRTVVFRHSSMYGGRQFATFDQGWIGWFCQQAIEAAAGRCEPLAIAGTGKQVRDVLHARDLTAVYLQAAAAIERTAGQIYNIGGGMKNSLSLVELFQTLSELIGVGLNYRPSAWRVADQKVFVADVRRGDRRFRLGAACRRPPAWRKCSTGRASWPPAPA